MNGETGIKKLAESPTILNLRDPHKQNVEHRPWGYFSVFCDYKNLKTKLIVVKPGCRLSLQRHEKRDEVWVVKKGMGSVVLNKRYSMIFPEDQLVIPRGCWHRLANASETQELVIFEVQVGECVEDDIERKEDDYGRT